MIPGAPARLIAAELHAESLKQRQTLEQVFAKRADLGELPPSDRGLVRALVQASFRDLGRLDHGLSKFLERPLETLDPMVRAFLRIGVVQMTALETPGHAAVGATVEAAKASSGARKAGGLINAVLRRASENLSVFEDAPLLSVWPDWLAARLVADLGEGAAEALARHQLVMPELHLTARDPQACAASLGGELMESGSIRLPMGSVEALEGFASGDWWVQDAAAALPARLLAAEAGEHVIDLCAAPGGKTLQLAAAGAKVTAVDRSAARLARLRENLERTGLGDTVEIIAADASTWRPEALADAILLDAPCSALGTLARHPEGAWIKRESDIGGFPPLQADLLDAALDMLAPGGRLVYCVCTPVSAEGLAIVEPATASGRARRDEIRLDELAGFETSLTRQGDVLTLPGNRDRHDAFFISRLVKQPV